MPENLRMEQLGQNLEHVGMVGIQKAKGFFDDFKSFVNRGNVVDLAIGMIIGAAFTAIVNSLVNDIFGPVIGLISSEVALDQLFVVMRPGKNVTEGTKYTTIKAAADQGAITLNYGRFAQTVINFFLVALILFFFIKLIYLVKQKEIVKSTDRPCPKCKEPMKEGATRCPHCTSDVLMITEGITNHSALNGDL